jgi:serine/threonine protein kinase
MATVFEASHVRLPRRVALKVITAEQCDSREFLLRFRREAETLAKLDHPNLVSVFDWNVTESGQPYLVMELLSGEDLSQLLRRVGALPPPMAIHLFAQIAAALEVAHSHGIVHRDIKPSNVFLCQTGPVADFAKVLDFGIAKQILEPCSLMTSDRSLIGTPAYMAPEQARGDNLLVDARTDQFALGLVLYEMLSGSPAFYRRDEPPMVTLFRVLSEDPPPLSDQAMYQVILRALSKDPAHRYPELADFVAAVVSCCQEPLGLPILPQKTVRTPSNGALGVIAETRRFGEIRPIPESPSRSVVGKILLSLGVILLSLEGPTVLESTPASVGLREQHEDSRDRSSVDVPANRTATRQPAAMRNRVPLQREPRPSVLAEVPQDLERLEMPPAAEVPMGAIVRTKPLRKPPIELRMEVGFSHGSIGEALVLTCLRTTTGVHLGQYRNQVLRLEGADELHLSTPMNDEPKAELERCLRVLQSNVLMVPSIIEVEVK